MHPSAKRVWGLRTVARLAFFLGLLSVVSSEAALPYVHTQATAPIRTNQATLNGMVVPNGEPTVGWFEWGARGSFDQTTSPINVGNGSGLTRISSGVSNLAAAGTYQCRLVVSNSLGIRYGRVKMFTTGNRVASWGYWGAGATNQPANLTNIVAVSSDTRSFALRVDGTVIHWHGYGQVSVPTEVTDVTQIAVGLGHFVALRGNGTVWSWGNNGYGEANTPNGLTNIVDVAAGYRHSAALKADGSVVAWGWNNSGQTNVPPGLTNVVAIACGTEHTVALLANGTVAAWGRGDEGQLVIPLGLTNVVGIAAGGYNSAALRSDGTLAIWGDDTGPARKLAPTGLTGVVEVAMNGLNAAVLWADGRFQVWGDNSEGQTNVPAGLSNTVAISAGSQHFLAIADNVPPDAQGVAATGPANQDVVVRLSGSDVNDEPLTFRVTSLPAAGQLYQFIGGSRGAEITTPNTIVTDSGGRVIFAPQPNGVGFPYANFAFVVNDGAVDSLPAVATVNIRGAAAFTQSATTIRPDRADLNGMALPNGLTSVAWFEWGLRGNLAQSTSPQQIGAGTAVTRVTAVISNLAAQTTYQCRLVVSNVTGLTYGFPHLFSTGDRVFGWQSSIYDAPVAVPPGLSNAVAVAGGQHKVILCSDGTIKVWGNNDYGQTNPPPWLSDIVAISVGGLHSLALRSNGTVVGWGYNYSGQANTAGLSDVISIASGSFHNLALRANGTLVAWGNNDNGVTNIPPDLTNVVSIACGDRQNFAVTADGKLHAWGYNYHGQTSVPDGLENVVAAVGGYDHSLALTAGGTVVAWGHKYYSSGPTNVPPGLSNVVSVAAANNYSLALCADGSLTPWGGYTNVPAGASNTVAISAAAGSVLALGNIQPQVNAKIAYGPANHDLIITLAATDLNTEALTYRIQTLPTRGTLYQCDAGARGALITPNTTVTDPNARVIFAPAADEFGRPYASFTFVANDGTIDSIPATVTVNIQNSRAFTQPANNIRPTTAMLHGVASPNSFESTAWFEWGERGAYTQVTTPQFIGSGTGTIRVSEAITNLITGSAYQFRLVVSNSLGIAVGAMRWFTTGDQYVTWRYGLDPPDPSINDLVAVESKGTHRLGLRNDGTVVALSAGAPGVTPGLSNVVAISAGRYHSLALRDNGTVVAWGAGTNTTQNSPNYGQSLVPAELSNVVAIAGGWYHSLALRSNGTVVGWGYNSYGQTNVPMNLSNVVAIAAGQNSSLAIRSDGTVAIWGGASYENTNLPAGLDEVVAIAAEQVLRSDGTVVYWGDNAAPPPNLSNVVAIADEGVFLKADGTLVLDFQFYGQPPPAGLTNMIAMASSGDLLLGNAQPQAKAQTLFGAANQDLVIGLTGFDANGTTLNYRITSLPVAGTLYQFAAGARGPAITATNTPISDLNGRVIFVPVANQFASPYAVFSFVANDGRLDSSPASVTIHVQQARAFTQAATHLRPYAAQLNGMAVPNSYDSWSWFEWGARGHFDQTTAAVSLGSGFSTLRVTAAISNLISGGAYQCRVVVSNANGLTHGPTRLFTTGDKLHTWGNNSYGQLVLPPSLTNLVAMTGGGYHSLGLRNDGTVFAWGAGTNISFSPHYGQSIVPPGLSNVTAVAAGVYFSLALREDGTLTAWGNPIQGQAAAIAGLTNVIAVACGLTHALALQEDGTVITWGDNLLGPTNAAPGLSNVVAIAAGSYRNLFILANGSVVGWPNADAQSGLSEVVDVSGGDSHALAALANGDTTGSGWLFDDSEGEDIPMEVPASVSNTVAVASGNTHCLALNLNGTVVAWGYEDYYYSDTVKSTPNLAGVIAIAAGNYHNLALGGVIVPQAISQVVTGAANQDLTIALAAVNDSQLAMTKTIRSLPALGFIYQFTNGSRGAKLTAPNTAVSDSLGRILFAPDANGFGSPYSVITFSASDGTQDSLPATISIHIQPPLRPTISAFSRNLAGSAQLTSTGHSNTTYCVWASSNLVTWEFAGAPVQSAPGSFQFTDPSASSFAQRFYRISTECGTPQPHLGKNSTQANGQFDLRFTGGPYWTYRVWASTNLMNWELMGTADESQPGDFRFIDSSATNWPQRFYKVSSP
jgi:alpha-tubulin suppressor-like RCC1 family protein